MIFARITCGLLVIAAAAFAMPQRGAAAEPAAPRERPRPIVVAQATRTPPNRVINEAQMREQINAWVVGVAAGKLEGAPVRLVEEMSRVLDDGNEMQILPIITRGPSYNVHALLYLRGIDLAVVGGDVLDYFGKVQNIPRIKTRINYITQLFNSELQILVRPEINSLEDLKGKEVNFNTQGTAAAFTGSMIFDRLKIGAKKTYIPHPVAIPQMIKGQRFAAVVWVTAKPARPVAQKKWPPGFKFLSVPYTDVLADAYLPATLDSKDYPNLIPEGQTIDTVAVPTVLAAFNWPKSNPRSEKVARFVDYLFERFDRLRKPPFHPKWRNINLAAKIPGWNRLPAVEAKLKEFNESRAAKVPPAFQARAERIAPNDPQAQQKLFEEFLQWYRDRQNGRRARR